MRTNKLEAAESQLSDAIKMIFVSEFSLISVHTLAASARQVLGDLCKAKGIPRDFEDLSGFDGLEPAMRKKLSDAIRGPQNFMKHADKDPDAKIEYQEKLTHLMIYDACQLYRKLKGRLFPEGGVYQGWIFRKYAEDFGGAEVLDSEFPGWDRLPDPLDMKAYAELVKIDNKAMHATST